MIHWQTVKEFFGFGTPAPLVKVEKVDGRRVFHVEVDDMSVAEALEKINAALAEKREDALGRPVQPLQDDARVMPIVHNRQPPISLKKAQARKRLTNPKQFYRRGGQYYNGSDGSLIEDLMLLYVLGLFDDNEIQTHEQYMEEEADIGSTAPSDEDLLDMDVSDTPVEYLTGGGSDAYSYPTPPGPAHVPYVAPEPEPVKQESYSSAGSSYGSGSSDYDSGSSDSGGGSND